MAERPNAMAELHVFDLWAWVRPLIVAPGLEEDVSTNGAAAPPERFRLPGTLPVDVMVQQVAVLRHELPRFGLGIVRAEHRAHFRLVGEDAGEPTERVGVDADVGIDEDDDLPARELDAAVTGVRRAARAIREAHHGVGELGRHERRCVGARVVDDDELPRPVRHLARPERREAPRQYAGALVHRDDDRHERRRRFHRCPVSVRNRWRTSRAPARIVR